MASETTCEDDLYVSVESDPRLLRQKLQTRFQQATNRAMEVDIARSDHIDLMDQFLLKVGQSCGFCFVTAGIQSVHPLCLDRMTLQQQAFHKSLKFGIKYGKGNGPCYTCHIASCAGDKLHPKFASGPKTCPNPNFMLGCFVAIHSVPEVTRSVVDFLRMDASILGNAERMKAWIAAEHQQFRVQGMLVLLWAATMRDL